jgi:hypothetical protein
MRERPSTLPDRSRISLSLNPGYKAAPSKPDEAS